MRHGAGAAKRRIAAGRRAGAPARPAAEGPAGLEPPTTPGLAGGYA
ncbi:hypothetical protein AB0L10_25710 [Streptomyces flaveolus]